MRKSLIFVDHLEMWNLSHNKYLASSLHIRENESRFSEMLCDRLTAGPNKNCSLHNKLKLKYNFVSLAWLDSDVPTVFSRLFIYMYVS